MTMNKTTILSLALATLMIMGCETNPQHEMAARVESLETFVADLEAKAASPANEPINWQEADARFDQLFQPAWKASADQSLTGYRHSQEYLAGRYAAIRIRHASIDEIRQWITAGTKTWQGFVEGFEDP